MDRLAMRLSLASRAIATLAELAPLPAPSLVERDAAIQRFEYSTEACWKAAQAVLIDRYGVEAASPKAVIRACAQNMLMDELNIRERK